MRLTFAGNNFVSLQGRNIFPLKNPTNSLRAIFSTDAGQLSDSLKSFAGQNKYLQDCRQLCCRNIIFCSRFTGDLSDRLFAGQNENLPVLFCHPALFLKAAQRLKKETF